MEDPPRQPPFRGEGHGHAEDVLEGLERLSALRGDQLAAIPVSSGPHPAAHVGDGPGPVLGSLERQAGTFDRSLVRASGVTMKKPMNVRRRTSSFDTDPVRTRPSVKRI